MLRLQRTQRRCGEMADATDLRFRNRRFRLVTSRKTPITIFIGRMSPLARIVAGIEGPPSEGLKVEQNLLENLYVPFTQRQPRLWGAAYRVLPSKEEAI
jgi:hypothetical protein